MSGYVLENPASASKRTATPRWAAASMAAITGSRRLPGAPLT